MASEKYEKARKTSEATMTGGIRIVFPAFDNLPGKTLYWGTSRFESADGDDYRSALSEMPSLRSIKGAAQDYVEFSLNDPESNWYDTVKPYEDVFEDTLITVSEFLKTEDDVFEGEILLEGSLEKFSINESNLTLSFSGISDMSRTGKPVGGRILSQRYCAAKFNYLGLLSALLDACGWQTGQGGNPVFCTHKRTGPDGCEDHWNDHRFVAVEGLTSAEIQYVAGGGIGGGGWEYGGGSIGNCFTPETLVWMADGSYKPIWRVKVGDYVMSFTPSGKLVKRKVLKTFRSVSDHIRHLDFGKKRTLGTKDEHFILTGKDFFQPADKLASGSTVRSCKSKYDEWFDLMMRSFWREKGRFRMCNFHVHDTMTYFVVLPDGTKIGVHNLKDILLEGNQQ